MSPASPELRAEVADLINTEAYLLDRRRWADWIALYADDAVFWVPAHVGDDAVTTDPDNEVSLMYMDRAGLEARIFRIESGDSIASDPLPRTAHVVSNILIGDTGPERIEASATWIVHSHGRPYGPITRGGLYDFVLTRVGDGLGIARKTITIVDDQIVGPLDIYNI